MLPRLLYTAPSVRIDQLAADPYPRDVTEEPSCPDHGSLPPRMYLGKTGYMDMFTDPGGWRAVPPKPLRFDHPSELEWFSGRCSGF
jgi:hypothetical protein